MTSSYSETKTQKEGTAYSPEPQYLPLPDNSADLQRSYSDYRQANNAHLPEVHARARIHAHAHTHTRKPKESTLCLTAKKRTKTSHHISKKKEPRLHIIPKDREYCLLNSSLPHTVARGQMTALLLSCPRPFLSPQCCSDPIPNFWSERLILKGL